MGMVRLVGMSLLVFVWVDLCGRMMKIGWKDRASMRVVIEVQFGLGMHEKHLRVRKKEVYFGWLFFFSCEQRWRISLEGCRFYLSFSFCEPFVS